MGTPCAPLLYLGCREEGQRILDEPLDLDLHGGQRALEHGQSLQEGVGDGHRPHPSPRQHQGGCPPALYLLEGAAQALVTVQVIMNHLCRENRNISRSVPGHREPWRGTMAAGGIDPWVGLGVLPELASASQPALTCADLVVRLVHDELVRGHAEVAGALWGQRDVIGAHRAQHSPSQPFPPLLPHSPPRPPCPRPWRPS